MMYIKNSNTPINAIVVVITCDLLSFSLPPTAIPNKINAVMMNGKYTREYEIELSLVVLVGFSSQYPVEAFPLHPLGQT